MKHKLTFEPQFLGPAGSGPGQYGVPPPGGNYGGGPQYGDFILFPMCEKPNTDLCTGAPPGQQSQYSAPSPYGAGQQQQYPPPPGQQHGHHQQQHYGQAPPAPQWRELE